jgi:hypothetical protein
MGAYPGARAGLLSISAPQRGGPAALTRTRKAGGRRS